MNELAESINMNNQIQYVKQMKEIIGLGSTGVRYVLIGHCMSLTNVDLEYQEMHGTKRVSE